MSTSRPRFCRTGKLGYLTADHANQAARRLILRTHRYYRPYLCDCGWWHLTQQPWRHRRVR